MAIPESLNLVEGTDRHPTTISTLISCYAEGHPDHIAIINGDQLITYRELDKSANQFAHHLQKIGIKQDDIIAIALERSPEMMICILGILKIGAAYLPLDYTQPQKRLITMLIDSESTLLITRTNIKEKFADYKADLFLIETDFEKLKRYPSCSVAAKPKPENLSYLIYTSGSTGKPKGVLVENKSVTNYIHWLATYTELKPQQYIDFSTNFIFDMAVTTSVAALALGLQIVICSDDIKKNIRSYLKYLRENKINIIKITPSYFKILLEEVINQQIELTHLQIIILGGENLNADDCKHWLEIFPQHILFNEYGPTEATVAVTQFKITSENSNLLGKIVPIGKAGNGAEIFIIGEDGRFSPCGEIGELYIGGICLARGYLKHDELTQTRFIQNQFIPQHPRLYKTGDLGRFLPDGNIHLLGRIDDQVKIRGFRIDLGEIEEYLNAHKGIKKAVILVHVDQRREKKLIAFYIPATPLHSFADRELRKYLLQHMADYMIPSLFIKREFFPLTENGKLDKVQLLSQPFFNNQTSITARTMLEEQLIKIWTEILDINQIGIDDNFLELGGHSLAAARIISKIEKLTGKRITLNELHHASTIRKLAVVVEQTNVEAAKKSKLPKRSSLSRYPLSDFQFMFWISRIFERKVKRYNIVSRKRIAGRLNFAALYYALEVVIQNHELLTYNITKYIPAMRVREKVKFKIKEKNIAELSLHQQELILQQSMQQLTKYNFWKKHSDAKIVVRLFYLADANTEIQISMPHIFSDDRSIEILFADIGQYYLSYNKKNPIPTIKRLPFKEYAHAENSYIKRNIKKDILFWQNYLKDSDLVTFPEEAIIGEADLKKTSYSTFLELSEQWLQDLHKFSTQNGVSITDLLCALIVRSLKNYVLNADKKIFINIIKSTRENEIYDETIGCFIRLDPFKIDYRNNENIFALTKRIQKNKLETIPYQGCSSMVKLACLNKKQGWKITNALTKLFITFYANIFGSLHLNPHVLHMYTRLASLRTKTKFLININIFNNFVAKNRSSNWCGFELKNLKTFRYDLSNINNVIDISFLKDENLESSYVVISANLKPTIREYLGNEIISGIRDIQITE